MSYSKLQNDKKKAAKIKAAFLRQLRADEKVLTKIKKDVNVMHVWVMESRATYASKHHKLIKVFNRWMELNEMEVTCVERLKKRQETKDMIERYGKSQLDAQNVFAKLLSNVMSCSQEKIQEIRSRLDKI
ncbi:ORF3 [Ranid herpesvirus 2]|uniref:ORF3 n=1 Tax=Ranid herpesvirus 2 TaxID=389214 RepID=Q14WA3_9VIRU|nr:ORF3 [Ranid herpesvirus 2]ABG25569.1 ORF3 [Ranid herpesvirus 2]